MPALLPPARAWLRPVPDAYWRCLRPGGPAPDVARAREQQRAYAEALVAAGVPIGWLPPEPASPDACFPEDVAVVVGGRALVARSGAPARRVEARGVAPVLARTHEVRVMRRGTLDGGDVLRVGGRLFVGQGGRTDAEGLAALGWLGLPVVPVPVRAGLHLRSRVSPLGPDRVLVGPGADPAPFRAAGLAVDRAEEPEGGNVLLLGAGRALVSAAAPRTAERLAREWAVTAIDISEFHRGDAGLTCLSLRVPPADGWCG